MILFCTISGALGSVAGWFLGGMFKKTPDITNKEYVDGVIEYSKNNDIVKKILNASGVENEEDIENKLKLRLIEYKQIKAVSSFFKERHINSGEIYSKKPEIIEIEEEKAPKCNEDIFKNLTLIDLYNIYNNILDTYHNKQNNINVVQRKIYTDKYKVEDKMKELLDRFNNANVIEFRSIIKESESKLETVVTFLALLELIKLRVIIAYQEGNFKEILMKRRVENE